MTIADPEKCDECGTCISVCPHDAIVLGKVLRISEDRCTSCGICVNICPFAALSLTAKDK
ncbi:MAG: 4Fe-4S binding protein [Chitinispirillia bacterium]|nr:4Fe-4S binding protein [Chitinispirillia bacterium]MCL2219849.1 4Fe-4S binding protein [Chitinispirillia bacterium]MCL2267672.1 4Fe-4S binding protein [Chitinispirillia bacterium]